MATFTDLSELDGYEVPASGETIEINIAENYYGAYELYGANITDFNAEDGNQVGEVVIGAGLFRFYNLDGDGEGVTITFEVSQNQDQSRLTFSIAFYDTEGSPLGDYLFHQEAGTSPTPTPSDGQHKIYRSGQQVMKMYRSGELIYLRLNPPSEEPVPPTPEPTWQWVEITSDFDHSLPFTKVRWDLSKSAAWATVDGYGVNGYLSEIPGVNADGLRWSEVSGSTYGYAGANRFTLRAPAGLSNGYVFSCRAESFTDHSMTQYGTQVSENVYEYTYPVTMYWGGIGIPLNPYNAQEGTGVFVYVLM